MMSSTPAATANRTLLNELLERKAIDIQASELFHLQPSPLPTDLPFSKVEGMLLGLAVGDALGITSEGLVPHLQDPSPELWVDTALSAAITHNDSASIASCVAFISMLRELLGMSEAPEPQWWVDKLTGRTTDSDDGRVFELIEKARVKWWLLA